MPTFHLPLWLRLPRTCLLCSATADHPNLAICVACEADLPWLESRCSCCALPLPSTGLHCGECQRRQPAFNHVQAPWRYHFPIDALITRFKHQAQWPLGHLLTQLLAEHLRYSFGEGLSRPELLLPVPLAKQRQRLRGFNQAQMISQWLSRQLSIAYSPNALVRSLNTPPQQGLDAKQRRRNLRQAFSLPKPELIAGKHVALVDDVLTTGATADTLAQLLLRAGAKQVDVYCLARTPKPGS